MINNKGTIPGQSNDLTVSFVPGVLRRKYAGGVPQEDRTNQQAQTAVLLWIDICSFSPLCNRLMKDKVEGVERITRILNKHYDHVLGTVAAYGGEPLFFAGDGVMIAWPDDQVKPEDAVPLAAACAQNILALRSTINDRNELLSMHAVIAAGQWQMLEMEGLHGNLLFSFFGSVFEEIVAASRNEAPNQVLISNHALSLMGPGYRAMPMQHHTSILYETPAHFLLPPKKTPKVTRKAIGKLRQFLPQTLVYPLSLERLKWIAEIRPVTVLFVRLVNYSNSSEANIIRLQNSVALTTPLVLHYGGLINQIWMDEKDSNILIYFGPPPSAHMDDPERGVYLALELHRALLQADFHNSIGVSSGQAYCGILGNNILRQYTVIGDVVNLSARIAGLGTNHIYCDKATFQASNKSVFYKTPREVAVKGFSEPVALYQPVAVIEAEQPALGIDNLVGREKERAILMEAYHNALSGSAGCVLVAGESGIGKTRFLEDFKSRVCEDPIMLLPTAGDFIGRHILYNVWEPVFAAILGISQATTAAGRQEALKEVQEKFGAEACVLNAVLQCNLPDSEAIKSLTESQKVAATHRLMLRILKEESEKQPLVIVVDDAHWMADDVSWKLVEALTATPGKVLVVLAVQELDHNLKTSISTIKPTTISLQELPEQDVAQLICARLNVNSVSTDLIGLIRKIAKGNPFHCIELLGSLVNQNLLSIDAGHCSFVGDVKISDLSMPDTVRGAIRERIDHLAHGSQLSLKVASVAGNRFGKKLVHNVYPIKTERRSVPYFLKDAEIAGFIRARVIDNMDGYSFNNVTTSEVAYEMTLAEQRRYLHQEIAQWYENEFPDNLFPYHLRLAHHWYHAGEKNKAVSYHEREAIRLFRLGYVKQALEVGLEGVKLLHQPIEKDPAAIGQKIGEHLAFINDFMQHRSVEQLADHKKLEDESVEVVIRMLLELCPFAHQCQQVELFALMTITSLRLTLEAGNGRAAAQVYGTYAVVYKAITQDSVGALAWSNLALVVDGRNHNTLQARVNFTHGWFIAHWLVPYKTLIPIAAAGADAGLDSNDMLFGCFNLSLTLILQVAAGAPLSTIVATSLIYQQRNNRNVLNAAFHLVHEAQMARVLQGLTNSYTSLSDTACDEAKDIANICTTDLYNQIGYYLISKVKLHVHFGNWQEAIAFADQAMPLLPAFANQPGHTEYEFYTAIASLYAAAETAGATAVPLHERADTGIKTCEAWAQLFPGNFANKLLLLQAIRAGLEARVEVAEQLFMRSAQEASAQGFIHECGLAYEHLARMQQSVGMDYTSSLDAALIAYKAWGAAGKVDYLKKTFSLPL
ncbi:Adenylate and Guanylate cyclase catalytic domain-containing protein [Cnuella takakiae]|uniref:Adenylate and Guanylate cyclase catalytic domain-containing protein n=1 Tax=Cnuella takakiae TaxID=1302690 RepID=A0A1M4SZX2_9BACT|nr:AAA and adenylate/guanylate cyclase domain-containing protein [Cnuella takakiae]OLY90643.1 hypothetical protein BUE76_01030 [Cnuella takakiae]SHE37716.1 Adenylate and Guanylate cyclase catalytic domain-containing protein [Cnuella takakiae]